MNPCRESNTEMAVGTGLRGLQRKLVATEANPNTGTVVIANCNANPAHRRKLHRVVLQTNGGRAIFKDLANIFHRVHAHAVPLSIYIESIAV